MQPEKIAIRRLRNLPPEPSEEASDAEWAEWRSQAGISTIVEAGKEIDEQALLERLRAAGVKIKS